MLQLVFATVTFCIAMSAGTAAGAVAGPQSRTSGPVRAIRGGATAGRTAVIAAVRHRDSIGKGGIGTLFI